MADTESEFLKGVDLAGPSLIEGLDAALFKESQEPILIADREGRIRYLNPAMQLWMDLPRQPPIGAGALKQVLQSKVEEPLLLEDYEAALKEGRTWTGEQRFHASGGESHPIRIRISPLGDHRDPVALVVVQFQVLEEPRTSTTDLSEDSGTNLLLDLLGTNMLELQAPLRSLAWGANLSAEDLQELPRSVRSQMEDWRAASQRILELFNRVQLSFENLQESSEVPEENRMRLLFLGGTAEQVVVLREKFLQYGLVCHIKVANAQEELTRYLQMADLDAALFTEHLKQAEQTDFIRELHRIHPGLPVFPVAGRLKGLAEKLREAVRRHHQERTVNEAWRRIEEVALRDPLTGVLNRRAFERFGRTEFGRAQRYGFPIALAAFDLDHFKQVNDTYGHPEGDRVLRAFATILQAGARETDQVARLGGDEFVILMPHTNGTGGLALINRLRQTGDQMLAENLPGMNPRASVSVGLAVYPGAQCKSLENLLAQADKALYNAKFSRLSSE